MRARTSLLLVSLVLVSACFRGDFLEGVSCTKDADCYPRFHCIPFENVGESNPTLGTCREPPMPDGTSSSGGSATGPTSSESGTGSTGSESGTGSSSDTLPDPATGSTG